MSGYSCISGILNNRSLVSTSSDFTTRDLHLESPEELLAAAWEYVAKERVPTPDKLDQADLLRTELDAQCKQFNLIMKQNSALLVAMAKGNGGSGGGGGGGGGGGSGGNRYHDQGTKVCAQTTTSWSSTRWLTVSRSQQTRTRFQPGTSPPSWIDRDRGPLTVSILTIGYCVINQNCYLQPSHYATIGPCSLTKWKRYNHPLILLNLSSLPVNRANMCISISPLSTLTKTAQTSNNAYTATMTTTQGASDLPSMTFVRTSSKVPYPWQSLMQLPLPMLFPICPNVFSHLPQH
jgi:hypothetical protein